MTNVLAVLLVVALAGSWYLYQQAGILRADNASLLNSNESLETRLENQALEFETQRRAMEDLREHNEELQREKASFLRKLTSFDSRLQADDPVDLGDRMTRATRKVLSRITVASGGEVDED